MLKKAFYCMMAMVIICIFGLSQAMAQSPKYKVLVVMSYEDDFVWCQGIKEGIDAVLKNSSEVRYFYMDTKGNLAGGDEKAKEAYALYQEFQPDGVITADDNAQSMFVVPYLKDKVKTPVMFCGVNAEAEKYGYPASNVSGILERNNFKESIAFIQQLVPSVKTSGYMANESPTGRALLQQVQKEADTYSAKFIDFKLPRTIREATEMVTELKASCDVLIIPILQGILGEDGKALTEKESFKIVTKAFGKPIIGNTAYNVKYGAFCAMLQKPEEQGETAAQMLLKAMQGTPVSEIPITRNQHGRAMINVTTMRALGIRPNPRILHTAELVKTEE